MLRKEKRRGVDSRVLAYQQNPEASCTSVRPAPPPNADAAHPSCLRALVLVLGSHESRELQADALAASLE
jgi:hypothetical protein